MDIFNDALSEKAETLNIKIFRNRMNMAKAYLLKNPDYNSFNRLFFLTNFIKPSYKDLVIIREDLKLYKLNARFYINLREPNMFSRNFFNLDRFQSSFVDSSRRISQIELGQILFFDPILSGNNMRACASCHKPGFAFADSSIANLKYDAVGRLTRNTPSLVNIIFQKFYFYDGRAVGAEDQADKVLHNKAEMNTTAKEIVNKLSMSDDYKILFRKAYAGNTDTTITYRGVLNALAEYEKSLTSLNSKFDQYLSGKIKSLEKSEANGYNVFSGKALCGTCHFLPIFSGVVPPQFKDNEFEVIGTLSSPKSKQLDLDSGRIKVTNLDFHLFSFKTPTIRNIDLTGPYMHNGKYRTIDEVIDFYNKGGSAALGNVLTNQTLPFDSLQLTPAEKTDLKKFMSTLTDNPNKLAVPKKLPSFKDPIIDKRKIGGVY